MFFCGIYEIFKNLRTIASEIFQRSHHIESTSIRRECYVDTSKTKFRWISTSFPHTFLCNFDGRKIHVVSTHFFDVTLLVRKSTLFPRTFFDVISMVEKSTLFPRILFDVILMFEKSTLFPRTFFDVISMFEIVRYFYLLFST